MTDSALNPGTGRGLAARLPIGVCIRSIRAEPRWWLESAIRLDEAGYADMAASLRDVAAELGVPVLICLEGGYALRALAASVSATIAAFTGSVAPREAPPELASGYRSELRSRWQLA